MGRADVPFGVSQRLHHDIPQPLFRGSQSGVYLVVTGYKGNIQIHVITAGTDGGRGFHLFQIIKADFQFFVSVRVVGVDVAEHPHGQDQNRAGDKRGPLACHGFTHFLDQGLEIRTVHWTRSAIWRYQKSFHVAHEFICYYFKRLQRVHFSRDRFRKDGTLIFVSFGLQIVLGRPREAGAEGFRKSVQFLLPYAFVSTNVEYSPKRSGNTCAPRYKYISRGQMKILRGLVKNGR